MYKKNINDFAVQTGVSFRHLLRHRNISILESVYFKYQNDTLSILSSAGNDTF
jgi:hypothetical protein